MRLLCIICTLTLLWQKDSNFYCHKAKIIAFHFNLFTPLKNPKLNISRESLDVNQKSFFNSFDGSTKLNYFRFLSITREAEKLCNFQSNSRQKASRQKWKSNFFYDWKVHNRRFTVWRERIKNSSIIFHPFMSKSISDLKHITNMQFLPPRIEINQNEGEKALHKTSRRVWKK